MKSLPQWSATVLLTAPVGASALGLGDIELQSALNQPFRAEIGLSATAEELEGLRVGLASRETFERYGLDRSAELSTLEFTVARNTAGRPVIRVTSTRPIEDPFVTMLIEVTWPQGRSLREYTVLLDPPVFTPGIGAEPVRQAEAGTSSSGGGAIARAPQPAVPSETPLRAAAAARTTPAVAPGGTYGPVQNAETLWTIATQIRPEGVTVNQMMVALYEANPSAFDGNMNMLLRGSTLSVPDRASLLATAPAAATAEVARHEALWSQGPRSASASSAAPASDSSASPGAGPSAASASPEAPAAASADAPIAEEQPETQQARLRLVPPSTDSVIGGAESAGAGGSGDATGSGASAAEVARLESEVATLRAELEESRRLLALRDEQLQALQSRLGTDAALPVEAEVASTGAPGVDLEAEQLFVDEPVPAAGAALEADEPVAESSAAAEGELAAEAEQRAPLEAAPVSAAAPATMPPAVRSTPAPEPSLLARLFALISNPFLLIGVGVGAVLLTAVWYLRHRREEVEDVTGRWDALEAEVEEDVRAATTRIRRQSETDDIVADGLVAVGDTARILGVEPKGGAASADIDETLSSHTVINLDQGDSLAEADFHMAYGLYDQAAELVQKALETEPHRRDLKLKLLEVYFVWGNKDAFKEAARALRDEIGDQPDGDWDKVLIMGKQLFPDDALFAEAAGGGAVDVDLESGASPDLDFAFDDKDGGIDLDFGSSTSGGLDLELAGTGERIGGFADSDDDDEEVLDLGESLDIGERTAAGLEAALFAGAGEDEEDDARSGVDTEDTGSATAPDIDFEGLAATQESPTVESPASGYEEDDWAAALGLDADEDTNLVTAESVGPDAPTMESPMIGPDAPTMETPTIETAYADAPTVETPTVETAGPDAPTMETPTIEAAGPEAPTVETPTIESPIGGTQRLAALDPSSLEQTGRGFEASSLDADHTEEIDLDDLGLSVEDLNALPDDVGLLPSADDGESDTREQPVLSVDEDLLAATGVTEITDEDVFEQAGTAVLEDAEATLLAPGYGDGSGTEVISRDDDEEVLGGTSLMKTLEDSGSVSTGLDLDLDDLAAALSNGDTVEQPRASSFDSEVFGSNGATPLDLDVGIELATSDDPTATEDLGSLDPHTMTEIGTKLDLARAYIDMGDPDGARSILEEVLDEGDAGQRREAQGLIDALAG